MPYTTARNRGRQPFEVVILMACVATGLVGLAVPGARSPVVVSVLGDASWVWHLVLCVSGAVPLFALWAKPPGGLIIEQASMMWLATVFCFYGAAIAVLGAPTGATAAGITFGYGVAAAVRARQIGGDLKRVREAYGDALQDLVKKREGNNEC